MAIRLPSERRLDLGYVPPRPEVISTGDPVKEGLLCDCPVLANMSVCAPACNRQFPSAAANGRLIPTIQISHAWTIDWNLVDASLVVDVVAIGLESSDHLFRAFDARAWHFRWGRRSLAAVGVDDSALMGCHVHVLLTVASRNPTEHLCQSLRSTRAARFIGLILTQRHIRIHRRLPSPELCSSRASQMAFLEQ